MLGVRDERNFGKSATVFTRVHWEWAGVRAHSCGICHLVRQHQLVYSASWRVHVDELVDNTSSFVGLLDGWFFVRTNGDVMGHNHYPR